MALYNGNFQRCQTTMDVHSKLRQLLVCQYLFPEKYSLAFRTLCMSEIPPAERSSVEDILNHLERTGKFSEGNYDFVKSKVHDIDVAIIDLIQEAEKRIKDIKEKSLLVKAFAKDVDPIRLEKKTRKKVDQILLAVSEKILCRPDKNSKIVRRLWERFDDLNTLSEDFLKIWHTKFCKCRKKYGRQLLLKFIKKGAHSLEQGETEFDRFTRTIAPTLLTTLQKSANITLHVFGNCGASIVSVVRSSVSSYWVFDSVSNLDKLWRTYEEEGLHVELQDCFNTEEVLRLLKVDRISLKMEIQKSDYLKYRSILADRPSLLSPRVTFASTNSRSNVMSVSSGGQTSSSRMDSTNPVEIDLYAVGSGLFGSERHVSLRRQIILLSDKLGENRSDKKMFITGSFSEGFCYPLSDRDYMVELFKLPVRESIAENEYIPTLLLVQTTPGYCLLIDMTGSVPEKDVCLIMGMPIISSSLVKENHSDSEEIIHGPCGKRTIGPLDIDSAWCIKCSLWPEIANEWIDRPRLNGWPTPEMVQDIVKNGCHVVPIGARRITENVTDTILSQEKMSHIISKCFGQRKCPEVSNKKDFRLGDHEWRLSFSVAERYIMHSLNHTQFLVYSLLRLAMKCFLEKMVPGVLCSYFMKTIFFYTLETTSTTLWRGGRLDECFRKCLSNFVKAISEKHCPNYFVAENNMFRNKIDSSNQADLQRSIEVLKRDGAYGLLLATEPHCFSNTFEGRYIEMQNDYNLMIFGYLDLIQIVSFPLEKNVELYYMTTPMASLDEIKGFIYENEIIQQNDVQDALIMTSATVRCQMLMDLMRDFPQGNRKNREIRKEIEHILSSMKDGDLMTKTLTRASYLYLTGNMMLARSILKELLSNLPLYYMSADMSENRRKEYLDAMCGQGFSIGHKMRKAFVLPYFFAGSSLEVVPFPFRGLMGFFTDDFDSLAYAFALLDLCQDKEMGPNLGYHYLIDHMQNSTEPLFIAEIRMCLGILDSVYCRNEMAFVWFESVFLDSQRGYLQSMNKYDWTFISMMHIACLKFNCLNGGI